MKKYLLIIISLIALSFVLAGCGDNIAGEAVRGGRGAVDVAPVVQYETGNWAYLKNDKTYSIETSCTEAGSVGKPWAKMMEGGFSCYKSGGKEGVDWKYCDLDRQGNPSTYGIAINNWAYLTNDGKYTIQEGCTEAGSTGKPWGLMKTGGYPCYLSGGKQGVDWMYCPKVEGYDLSLTYGIELGMTKLMFDETLKHSLIIASDLVRFKHTFPNKEINVNNPEEMFNTMYFGINTKEKAQNLVDHLVFENVQKLLNVKFDLTQEYSFKEGNVQNFGTGFDSLIESFEKGLIEKEDAFGSPGGQPAEGGQSFSQIKESLTLDGEPCVGKSTSVNPVKGADKAGGDTVSGGDGYDTTPGQAGDKTSATAGLDGDTCTGFDLAKMQGGGVQVGKSTEQKMNAKGWGKISGTSYEGGYGFTNEDGYSYSYDVKVDFETFTNNAGDKQTLQTTTVKETVTNPQGQVIQSDKKVKQGDPKPVSGEPKSEEKDVKVKEPSGDTQDVELDKVPPKADSIGDPNAEIQAPASNPACAPKANSAITCSLAQFGAISNNLFGTGEGSGCEQDELVKSAKGCGLPDGKSLENVQLNFFTSATSPNGGAIDPGSLSSVSTIGSMGSQAASAAESAQSTGGFQ